MDLYLVSSGRVRDKTIKDTILDISIMIKKMNPPVEIMY